jgi:phage terminase Nu1 subunit (DNA packaging protein)
MGISARRLRQIEAEGMPISRNDKGQYLAEAFGKWLDARRRSQLNIDESGTVFDYDVERARLTKNQADEKGLQVQQLRGELIPRETVIATWQAYTANTRAKLLSLPTKAAHAAIAATELHEIEEVLKDQVYEALSELESDGIPDGYRGLDAGIEGVESTTESDSEQVGGSIPKTKPRSKRRARTVAN